LCDDHQLHPTDFCPCVKLVFDSGAAAFGPAPLADNQVEVREQRTAFPETNLEKQDVVVAELMEEYLALRKSCGDLKIQWMPHDTRDQVIDFLRRWGGRRSPPGGLCAGWA
jgi:ribonuclease HI